MAKSVPVMDKMIDAACPLCGSQEDFTVLYPQNFQPQDLNKDVFSARRLPDRLHYRVVRCNKDGMVRSTPIMAQEGLARLYQESHFTYKEETDSLARTYVRALMPALIAIGKEGRILEIGCGNGFVLSALRAKGYSQVFGVEPGREAFESADPKLKGCIRNDMLRPGLFEAGTFDLIAFFQVLDHIADPNAFLMVCRALLKPGGYIVAFQHNVSGWSHALLRERCPIIDVEHTHLYDPKTGGALFTKNGFNLIAVTSPANLVSLRHLVWLSPLPARLKHALITSKNGLLRCILSLTLWLKLGNVQILAKRE